MLHSSMFVIFHFFFVLLSFTLAYYFALDIFCVRKRRVRKILHFFPSPSVRSSLRRNEDVSSGYYLARLWDDCPFGGALREAARCFAATQSDDPWSDPRVLCRVPHLPAKRDQDEDDQPSNNLHHHPPRDLSMAFSLFLSLFRYLSLSLSFSLSLALTPTEIRAKHSVYAHANTRTTSFILWNEKTKWAYVSPAFFHYFDSSPSNNISIQKFSLWKSFRSVEQFQKLRNEKNQYRTLSNLIRNIRSDL